VVEPSKYILLKASKIVDAAKTKARTGEKSFTANQTDK
jgi:hypothetical protein